MTDWQRKSDRNLQQQLASPTLRKKDIKLAKQKTSIQSIVTDARQM